MPKTVDTYLKFWSDMAFQNFTDQLDLRHPSNLFEVDDFEMGVAFFTPPDYQTLTFAKRLGATEEDPDEYKPD